MEITMLTNVPTDLKKKKKTFDISDILWGQKKKRKKMK